MEQQPKTLQQAIQHYADEQVCIDTVAALRWPNGPKCPACGNKDHRIRMKVRENNWSKTVIMGMLERGGKVQAKIVPDRRKDALCAAIQETIEKGSQLYTDEHPAYLAVEDEYAHKIVNHLERYVDGKVHTQTIENFWS